MEAQINSNLTIYAKKNKGERKSEAKQNESESKGGLP